MKSLPPAMVERLTGDPYAVHKRHAGRELRRIVNLYRAEVLAYTIREKMTPADAADVMKQWDHLVAYIARRSEAGT